MALDRADDPIYWDTRDPAETEHVYAEMDTLMTYATGPQDYESPMLGLFAGTPWIQKAVDVSGPDGPTYDQGPNVLANEYQACMHGEYDKHIATEVGIYAVGEEPPRSMIQQIDGSRASLADDLNPLDSEEGCSAGKKYIKKTLDVADHPHAASEDVAANPLYAVASGGSGAGTPKNATTDNIYGNADALEGNEPLYEQARDNAASAVLGYDAGTVVDVLYDTATSSTDTAFAATYDQPLTCDAGARPRTVDEQQGSYPSIHPEGAYDLAATGTPDTGPPPTAMPPRTALSGEARTRAR